MTVLTHPKLAELQAHLEAQGCKFSAESRTQASSPWDDMMAELVARLGDVRPEQIPAGTRLGQHSGSSIVTDPAKLLASLRAEVARGPNTVRALSGALRQQIDAVLAAAERKDGPHA